MTFRYKKIIVKVGSNVLTSDFGTLDIEVLEGVASQIAELVKKGIEVVLVSSGAVASGKMSLAKDTLNLDDIGLRQVYSAVGQVKLLQRYDEAFGKVGLQCAQILVTKEDFRDRNHYLNMKNCFENLVSSGIVPIVNENDVVSVTELMFTDNDELAGLISTMLNVDALFILTNVDGIYAGAPSSGAKVISQINIGKNDLSEHIQVSKSQFGRGGMLTKSNMALKVAKNGIWVHIVNGKKAGILDSVLNDSQSEVGTTFIPNKTTSSNKKRIAFSDTFANGSIYLNEGAIKALQSNKATSILPIGVIRIEGDFKKGDIVNVNDAKGNRIGIGRVSYSASKGNELLGKKNQKAIVHYDYLFLN